MVTQKSELNRQADEKVGVSVTTHSPEVESFKLLIMTTTDKTEVYVDGH